MVLKKKKGSKSKCLITVLLCVFNGEIWLRECIESILNQTYKDYEFLIIDDGSNDKSLSIIKEYAEIDKRIKYISHYNIGLTESLNKGLKEAKGEWIARIDCDDISLPQRLELQLNYVLTKNFGIVGCQSIIIDKKGSNKKKFFIPVKNDIIYFNLIRQKRFFSHSSVLFNKKLVLNLGGYRKCMKKAQDYDLWLRISEISKLGCLKYFGVHIREHENRISFNYKGIQQRIYAHCALISHIIRTKYGNKYDPLSDNSQYKFSFFFNFVSKRLEESNTLIFYEKIYDFKNNSSNFGILKNIFFIPIYFNKFDLIQKLFKWIYIGDFISKGIAKEWLELNKKTTNE
tara:strand:- start:8572 stop:9603 length:1032 start_codon:yes stop_codon:yes gene_type:complete